VVFPGLVKSASFGSPHRIELRLITYTLYSASSWGGPISAQSCQRLQFIFCHEYSSSECNPPRLNTQSCRLRICILITGKVPRANLLLDTRSTNKQNWKSEEIKTLLRIL